MALAPWPTSNRLQGVPHKIPDFGPPLRSIPDQAARPWPVQVYTIFNRGVGTFTQIRDAANLPPASPIAENGYIMITDRENRLDPGERLQYLPREGGGNTFAWVQAAGCVAHAGSTELET